MTRHPTRGILPLLAAASLLLTACSDDTSTATPPASSTTPSSGATQGESSTTPSAGATGDPTGPHWKLLSNEPEGVELDPGAYGLTANGVSDHVVVVQAPEGYQNIGGWTFVTGEPFRAMGFVTADRVLRDPCGSEGHRKFDAAVDPGPSVQDLAEALVAQKGAATSEPVPVTVDGRQGLYLTYQVAKGIDIRECEARAYDSPAHPIVTSERVRRDGVVGHSAYSEEGTHKGRASHVGQDEHEAQGTASDKLRWPT